VGAVPLNLSKVAVRCTGFDALDKRVASRAVGGSVAVVTRFMPKRAEELGGGSLYWIVRHRLVGRQAIIGFGTAPDGRAIIRLDSKLVRVRASPKRAHQGWRYLEAADAPADLDGEPDGIDALPPRLLGKLTGLALV
jgi:hypothetical protein